MNDCVLPRNPDPSGRSCAALNTGHIPASHHHRPADNLLPEVNKSTQTQPQLCSPAFSLFLFLLVCMCQVRTWGGGGLEIGDKQGLMGKQLHLK